MQEEDDRSCKTMQNYLVQTGACLLTKWQFPFPIWTSHRPRITRASHLFGTSMLSFSESTWFTRRIHSNTCCAFRISSKHVETTLTPCQPKFSTKRHWPAVHRRIHQLTDLGQVSLSSANSICKTGFLDLFLFFLLALKDLVCQSTFAIMHLVGWQKNEPSAQWTAQNKTQSTCIPVDKKLTPSNTKSISYLLDREQRLDLLLSCATL